MLDYADGTAPTRQHELDRSYRYSLKDPGRSSSGDRQSVRRVSPSKHLSHPPFRLTAMSFSSRPTTPLSPSPNSAINKLLCNSHAPSSTPRPPRLTPTPGDGGRDPWSVSRDAVSRAFPAGGGMRPTPPPSPPHMFEGPSSENRSVAWPVSSSRASKPRRAYLRGQEAKTNTSKKNMRRGMLREGVSPGFSGALLFYNPFPTPKTIPVQLQVFRPHVGSAARKG